jgi:hypothetical protein
MSHGDWCSLEEMLGRNEVWWEDGKRSWEKVDGDIGDGRKKWMWMGDRNRDKNRGTQEVVVQDEQKEIAVVLIQFPRLWVHWRNRRKTITGIWSRGQITQVLNDRLPQMIVQCERFLCS